jgi:hypothetical protein
LHPHIIPPPRLGARPDASDHVPERNDDVPERNDDVPDASDHVPERSDHIFADALTTQPRRLIIRDNRGGE